MKKLLLSLGTVVSVTAPVVGVIACSVKTNTPTKTNLELNNYVRSSKFINQLETVWQHNLLKGELKHTFDFSETDGTAANLTDGLKVMDINKGDNSLLKEALKYTLIFNTNKDSSYIRKLGQRILSLNSNVKSDDLYKEGLLTDYHNGSLAFASTGTGTHGKKITDKALNLLFNTKVLDIRNSVYKEIIIQDYLKESKEDWAKAFKRESENLTNSEKMIDNANFLLIRELLNKRYFAKWEINLDDNTGNYYGHTPAAHEADMFAEMTTTGTVGQLASLLPRSEAMAHINPAVLSFGAADATITPLGAFKGITSMPRGSKTFSFDYDELRKAKTSNYWSGFVQDNQLVHDDIKYTDEKTPNKVKVTYVKGIMPYLYESTGTNDPMKDLDQKLILGKTGDYLYDNKDKIVEFIAVQDKSLYNQAMAYYTTKRGTKNANILKITNEEVRVILDEAGVKFIKERDAE